MLGVLIGLGIWLALIYVLSRIALFLLLRELPVADHNARTIAKHWSAIGAIPLSGWVLLALVTGPTYPLVIGGTAALISVLAPVVMTSSIKAPAERYTQSKWGRYVTVSLVLVLLAIVLASLTLRLLFTVLHDD
ncbi:MAG: hypothetical protein IT229_03395 [Flavobacteriales bacterium]|nr:hypothetical protein [Flavobacteriales bacterium]